MCPAFDDYVDSKDYDFFLQVVQKETLWHFLSESLK